MTIKKMRRQNSCTLARKVFPSTCRPTEWRLSLNMRNTRTRRMMRSTEKEMDEFLSSLTLEDLKFFSNTPAPSHALTHHTRLMKNGATAMKSSQLRKDLTKCALSGQLMK